jgi:peroxiredoxin
MTARIRNLARAVSLALGVSLLVARAPIPRKSPELTFFDASGKETSLSSFRGRVVLVEFLLTGCPHCVRVAQTINKLHKDLGPRGFQPIGIAFDSGISRPLVTGFVQFFKIAFPVGYTASDKVDSYLGRVGKEHFQVPQIVVIDRQGVIRAQSHPIGETTLENETDLRNLIDTLLKE